MTTLAAPYRHNQGFIFIPLPMVPHLPERLSLGSRTYLRKSDLICTIAVTQAIPDDQQRVLEACVSAINKHKPTFDGYLNDLRLAQLPAQNRYSIIVRARVNGLREVYATVNRELKLELPVPPAHVTLYIADNALPVPIPTPADLASRTTALTAATRDELTPQLDPYKSFSWSYFQSPAPVRNNLTLEFHVPSFGPAREFYRQFGFTQIHYDPISGGGESDLGYFEIKREDSLGRTQLNFYGDKASVAKHAHFNEFPAGTPRGYAIEVTIPVDDVEDLWKRVGSKLPPPAVSQPLEIKRWGKRDFRVVDPFGFYIRFTEPVDWMQDR